MRFFTLIPRLFLALGLLGVIALSAYELQLRAYDRKYPVQEAPLARAQTLLGEERWEEARLLARFVKDHPAAGDAVEARKIAAGAFAGKRAAGGKVERFLHGAVTGEPEDIPSLLGSLSLDLFVVGDIRDLAVQGYKEWQYDDGDKLILGLSAVGLATSLTPVLDWAPAVMKGFKRSGALTPGFTKALGRTSADAMKTRKFGALADVAADFGKATKRLGPGPMKGAMKAVDSERSLKRLANAAAVNPAATYSVASLMGKRGIKLIRIDGKNIGKVAGHIKVGSRLVKSLRKTTRVVPDGWLWGAMLAGWFLLAALFLRRRRRRSLFRGAFA